MDTTETPAQVFTLTKAAISEIESHCITIGPSTPVEVIADIRNRVKFIGAEARRVAGLLNDVLVERIVSTGQDIELPTGTRLFAGTPPKYEIRGDGFALFESLFDAAGGDLHAVYECLCSGWYLTSQLKSRFEQAGRPELFDKFIKTTREPVLKEGKPSKQLLEHNPAFSGRGLAVRS